MYSQIKEVFQYMLSLHSANTHEMKAAKDTLDNVIVQRLLKQQNLCLDKGYDFSEIERESTKTRRYIAHIRHTGEGRLKDKVSCKKIGCRNNKFTAQQI